MARDELFSYLDIVKVQEVDDDNNPIGVRVIGRVHDVNGTNETLTWKDIRGNINRSDKNLVTKFTFKEWAKEDLKVNDEVSNGDCSLVSTVKLITDTDIYMTKWNDQGNNELMYFSKSKFNDFYTKGEWKLNKTQFQIDTPMLLPYLSKYYIHGFNDGELELNAETISAGDLIQYRSSNGRRCTIRAIIDGRAYLSADNLDIDQEYQEANMVSLGNITKYYIKRTDKYIIEKSYFYDCMKAWGILLSTNE